MLTLHNILISLHILLGSMALVLFWIPIVSKKGSLDHVKYGRIYANVMYAVAATGASMATLVIIAPLTIKHHLITADTDLVTFAEDIRAFWSFLLYLSLLTFAGIRHGILVLRYKTKRHGMRQGVHLVTLLALLLGGVALTIMGITRHNTLHIIFGLLGTTVAVQTLRYIFAKHIESKRWIVEHLQAFISTGIGAYTAFFAFGGRSMFSDIGQWQLVFWVAPGVIGGIASALLSRHYMPSTKRSSVQATH